ncbi:MAG: hypothetical protein F6K23_05035 [Okeania sp. SIO2C9]|uniref:hypothetical protein n=1 Tax=Okeania sp. SIO2C9 TaxID=2607791 RepID=UPI0013BF1392|nr:hypothetical protein [Okeania sp. SIO2C9]
MGRWGDGEMGRWGDGEMGRWGDGEMGRWGDGEMRAFFYLLGALPGELSGGAGSHPLFPLFSFLNFQNLLRLKTEAKSTYRVQISHSGVL